MENKNKVELNDNVLEKVNGGNATEDYGYCSICGSALSNIGLYMHGKIYCGIECYVKDAEENYSGDFEMPESDCVPLYELIVTPRNRT